MTENPIRWFEIYVQDMNRAKKFYETVFHFKLEKLDVGEIEMWAFPMIQDAPGAAGALVKMGGFDSEGNGTIVYFASEDCSTEEKRVVAAGGSIQRAKTSIGPYGFISLITDTERNIIGIHSMA